MRGRLAQVFEEEGAKDEVPSELALRAFWSVRRPRLAGNGGGELVELAAAKLRLRPPGF